MKSIVLFVFLLIRLFENALSTSFNSDWYKYTDIYEIDVGLFKDDDGDGFGDLQGLTSKLDHVKEMGFNCIKVSPIYSSIHLPISGYAINDFRKVHIIVGTNQDFDALMKEAQSKNIKVILDFIINDCSTSHEWFKKSRQQIDPYTDYFLWRDYTEEERSSGFSYLSDWYVDDTRKQLYYSRKHGTAELDFSNEFVKQEVKELIKFWFDKGVAGLNLFGMKLYIEDPLTIEIFYSNQTSRVYHPDSYKFVHELREFIDEYSQQKGDYQRILMVEQVSDKYYNSIRGNKKYNNLRGNETYPIAHIVSSNIINKVLRRQSNIFYNSKENFNLIQYIRNEMRNGPSLFISENSGSRNRLISKFENPQWLNTWIMSMSMCPGVFHMLYGQEIGLDNFNSGKYDFLQNYPFGSSMHWDDSINAGFTSSEFLVIPPNVNYWETNVKKYKNEKFSTLHMIEDLLQLRRTAAVKYGDLETYNITEFVFAFTRFYEDKESYLTIFNFENVVHIVELKTILDNLPNRVRVVAATPNASYQKGEDIVTNFPLPLRPASGMVLDLMKEKKP